MSLPLVTCLCLTTSGRQQWLQKAVDCFKRQTYPNKELLIVADSTADTGEIFYEWKPGDFEVVVLVPMLPARNIGDKRNKGCHAANGDIIAIWDDDDYSAPGRLEQQVKTLGFIPNSSVTGYRAMKFTDGSRWWQLSYPPGLVFGTSLCFTKAWWKDHQFLGLQIGEDAAFCEAAAQAGQLTFVGDRNLMYATIHPGNTSIRNTSEPGWVPLPGFEWKD